MQLLCHDEHVNCLNYISEHNEVFKHFELKEGSICDNSENDTFILYFLLKGEISISTNSFLSNVVAENRILLIPPKSKLVIQAQKDSSFILCSFKEQLSLCNSYSFNNLIPYCNKSNSDFSSLPITSHMYFFLQEIEYYLKEGMLCPHFFDLKKKELFFLFRIFYHEDDLATFFISLIGKDIDFKRFVINNYQNIKSVDEFAELSNSSVSTFTRRFKDHFGESVHQWILNQKANKIYYEIKFSGKSFQEIANNYEFSSQAHFNRFCKSKYGKAPGEMRKESSTAEILIK